MWIVGHLFNVYVFGFIFVDFLEVQVFFPLILVLPASVSIVEKMFRFTLVKIFRLVIH